MGDATTATGTLFLRESDVEKILDVELAIGAVHEGFRLVTLGGVQSPPWRDVRFAGALQPHGAGPGITQAMAYLSSEHVAVIKHFYSFGGVPVAILRLLDSSSGTTLAVMEASYESRMRTGAAGGVGAQYLARESATRAGILGTGSQARAQMEFLVHVRPIREIYAFSVDPIERQEAFAYQVRAATGIPVALARRAQDVVEKADVLVTATPATEPIVQAQWISEGLHITSIGADDSCKAELAAGVLGRADRIVIDSDKALGTKQFQAAFRQGTLSPDSAFPTIGELVAGIVPGRQNDREITVFHSAGTTVQDAAIALAVYRTACSRGIGVEIRPDRVGASSSAMLAAWLGEMMDTLLTSSSPGRRSSEECEGR